jgi:methylmalonyl-CoA/ethylmalonyl-CoA epimerase
MGTFASMTHIEHLGIAVQDAAASIRLFAALLGTEPYLTETVEREGVRTVFFKLGPNKIELLEATRPDSPIAKFLAKRGEGIHHVALAVDNIHTELARLQQLGFELLNPEPTPGADGKLIAFLHPRSTGGVLVELCQDALAG